MIEKAPTIDTTIRGPTLFPQGVRTHANCLVGDPIIVTREPDNPKHGNAILATTVDNDPIGYVARENADIIAPWMDRGWLYTAKVVKAAKIIVGRAGGRWVKPETLIVRLTPIPPAQRSTDISVFTDLLVTKSKDLETID